jgi:dUTP pyrophosphatase
MFQFARTRENAQVPFRANSFDAGMDLCSCENTRVPPGGRVIVDTGLAILIPRDCYARVAPRSGLAANHGIDVLAGVVDCTYTGNIKVILYNTSTAPFHVGIGDRIAQLIIEKIYIPDTIIEVSYDRLIKSTAELCSQSRGSSGFGSTGL